LYIVYQPKLSSLEAAAQTSVDQRHLVSTFSHLHLIIFYLTNQHHPQCWCNEM